MKTALWIILGVFAIELFVLFPLCLFFHLSLWLVSLLGVLSGVVLVSLLGFYCPNWLGGEVE